MMGPTDTVDTHYITKPPSDNIESKGICKIFIYFYYIPYSAGVTKVILIESCL